MSEIGSGSGSSYPSALDVNNVPEVNSPAAGKTKARKEVVEDLSACVLAIEGELGTDPSGTKTDVKTYLQTEHNTDGTHVTLNQDTTGNATTSTTATKATKLTDGTNIINPKIIEIGDWNMLTATGSATKQVVHGVTLSKIRTIQVSIRNDAGTGLLDFNYINSPTGSGLHGMGADATNITLSRQTSGVFDTTDYDSTSYNRGWITITYVD